MNDHSYHSFVVMYPFYHRYDNALDDIRRDVSCILGSGKFMIRSSS